MEPLATPPCDSFIKGDRPVVVIRPFSYQRDIKIELDPSAAPVTIENFLMLAQQGFYDGLKFHRLLPGFIVQGGCLLGTGDGETELYLHHELSRFSQRNLCAGRWPQRGRHRRQDEVVLLAQRLPARVRQLLSVLAPLFGASRY